MKILRSLLLFATLLSISQARTEVWIAGKGGIYHSTLDGTNGKLSAPQKVADFGSGSWLEFHPTEPVLYSTMRDGGMHGVKALRLNKAGELEDWSQIESPAGSPSHFAINPAGNLLVAAHWGGKSTTAYSIAPDGKFIKHEQTFEHTGSGPRSIQSQPRPHWAGFSDDGSVVHVTDLGSDHVWTFNVAAGKDQPLSFRSKTRVPAGMGPRHMAFSPDRRFAYVSEELAHHVTVLAHDIDTAELTPIQHIDAAPADLDETTNNVSEIKVHPNGKWVYTANRGHDSMAVFRRDSATGKLELVEHEPVRGDWPRNFNITDDGKWMITAGQNSGTLVVFAINPNDGSLRYNRSKIHVPSPVRVLLSD
ncbi:MAG: lactonase family protein [Synoicihabitans sp.]